jgi:hypothetical protein
MIQKVICMTCNETKKGLFPEDRECGWRERIVTIEIKTPETFPLDNVMCDECNAILHDGVRAKGITNWNINKETRPGRWEDMFGEVIYEDHEDAT